jgi:hypothetical protein
MSPKLRFLIGAGPRRAGLLAGRSASAWKRG